MKQREKFTIIVRIRPRIASDQEAYKEHEMEEALQESDNHIIVQRKNNEEKKFKFSHVLAPSSQAELYEKSRHMVESVFNGFNSTFLAYGQTGTGKTYSVFGNSSDPQEKGFFYRSVEDIFENIKKKLEERQFAVRISFIEFYMDNVFDLIDNSSRKLEIKESAEDGVHIKDLAEVSVKSAEELFNCVRKAIKLRKTEQTSINKRSSRSHAILQISLLQRWNQNGEMNYLKGILKIVDLAGSQRVSKTQSNGSRLQEAKRINKQITTLGKCINLLALAEKENRLLSTDLGNKFNYNKSHIPFRDSKITRFLSESLQGKSKIILCVCVSKFTVHLEQSFSSLMFAMQASTLKVDSRRNEIYSLKKSVEKVGHSNNHTPNKVKNRLANEEDENQKSKKSLKFGYTNQKNALEGVKLMEKFKREVLQINEFLDKKEVNSKSQSKEVLESNLHAMNKLFNILRQQGHH